MPETQKQVGNWQPVPRDQDVLFAGISPSVKAYTTDSFPAPQTKLAREVDAFAQKHLDTGTYRHSNRIYYFGLAILRATLPHLAQQVDDETWYITCLLHDIGLAEAFHLTTEMSFEVRPPPPPLFYL